MVIKLIFLDFTLLFESRIQICPCVVCGAVRECGCSGGGGCAVSPVRGAGSAGGAVSLVVHRGPAAEGAAPRGGAGGRASLPAAGARASRRIRTYFHSHRYIATIKRKY